MTSSPPLLFVVFMLLISSSLYKQHSVVCIFVSFKLVTNNTNPCSPSQLFLPPKRSLPPTTKNPLLSEIDTKATTNVVGNRFAGCASCGSCGVGQPHEMQNIAHFKQNKNRRGLTPQTAVMRVSGVSRRLGVIIP